MGTKQESSGMRPKDDWEELLLEETENIRQVFVTRSQFEQTIIHLLSDPNCPISGLQYDVKCPSPYVSFSIGITGPGSGDGTRSFSPHDNRGTECQVHYWRKSTLTIPLKLDSELEDFFESYWKSGFRTPSAGMPDLKRAEDTNVQARRTVEITLRKNQPCSLLFCDLDNFGQVNKERSHEDGDRIIKEFSAILENTTASKGVVLHGGGDEFMILLAGRGANRALELSYDIKEQVELYDFQTKDIHLGVSIGISTTEGVENASFDDLLRSSNKALNEYAKKPKKGVARFLPEDIVKDNRGAAAQRLNLALCIIKSNMISHCPFASVWLNSLSQAVYNCITEDVLSLGSIQETVDSFLEWASLSSLSIDDSQSAVSHDEGFRVRPSIARIDIPIAIAHGIFRAMLFRSETDRAPQLELAYDDREGVALLLSDNTRIWSSPGDSKGWPHRYDLGSVWTGNADFPQEQWSLPRALLIKIGNDAPFLPRSIFAGKPIFVDDRPSNSGGLPDFWEATIARLVAEVNRNPNLGAVYLLGDHDFGAQTVARLKDIESWADNLDQLSFKTGMPNKEIRHASSLLVNKVHFPTNEEDLLINLTNVLRPGHTVLPCAESVSSTSERFIRRKPDMSEMLLSENDGCRVKTIAEAYPIVIDIVRQNEETETIRDQAGQELRELVDFKVHLTNPHENQVPTFYKEEKKSLDAYFEQEFLSPTGLFGSEFMATSQLDAVLDHLVKIIKDSERQFATRRAILVVPHKVREGRDISPLGLVSVRLVPRFLPGRVRISFSFTWRTVEALIGFPYSLYGSVRYSEHLTELISNKLKPQTENEKRIEMGEVSYIAHSLHIFIDQFGQNIARAIVNNANI